MDHRPVLTRYVTAVYPPFAETTDNVSYIHDNEDIRPRLYNKKYLKNEDQTWILAEDKGVWGLVFRELSIEPSKNCRHDYLQIREIAFK